MTKTRETLLRLALATAALGLSPQIHAGTLWDGGGADNDWQTADNWDPDGTPGTGNTVDLTFAGSTRPTSNNNYADWVDFRNLDFATGAGAFTLTGANIDLFGRIENQSSSLQTVSLTLALNAGQPKTGEFNPAEGDLLINGANLFTNGNTIQVWGNNAHSLTFDTVIDGTGGLTLNQNSTVVLAKGNTYSGANTVSAGVLQIGNGGATGNFGSGTMTLGAAGTLAFNRTGSFSLGGITTAAGSKVAVNLGTVVGTAATSFGSQAAGNLVSVGSGGAIDLSGINRSSNTMDLTIAGTGNGGSGAIFNSGAALLGNSGIRNLTLSGNATVASGGTGEGNRWDTRADGTLTLNGNTLTKTGTGNFNIRSSVPLIASGTLRISGGSLSFEDNFTGANTANYTIEVDTSGAWVGAYNGRTIQSAVTLSNGGGIYSQGGTASTWGGTITVGSGGGRINAGNVVYTGSQINVTGALSGSGPLTIQGGSTFVVLANTASTGFTGKVTVDGGSLRIAGDGSLGATPGVATADAITLMNGGRIQGGNLTTGVTMTLNSNRGINLGSGGGGFHVWTGFTMTYGGVVTGSGTFNKTDGGTLALTGNLSGYSGTYSHQAGNTLFQTGANALTGTLTVAAGDASIQNTATNTWSAINLNGGTLRIKSNNNALGTATIAVGGSATLAAENGSTALTLANGATIAGTNTLSLDSGYASLTVNGNLTGSGTKVRTSASGTTTLGGTVNMGSNALGNVSVESTGTLVLSSTANVTAGNVFNNNATGILNINGATVNTGTLRLSGNGTINLNSGTTTAAAVALNNNSGVFNITGGTLNTQYLNLGDGSNTSGRIVQTGGTVNVLSGGTGFRIGHWNNGVNAGSSYNLSGGVLDATGLSANTGSARVVTVGWDGQGDMIVGGGAGSATFKSYGIQLDGNGNGGGAAPSTGNMTLTVSTNGLVEIGAGGTAAASTTDTVILNGGTLRATDNSTWSTVMVANASTTSTLQSNATFTATVSGDISGTGSVVKSGAGLVTFSTAKTLSGPIAVNEGRLLVSSTLRNTSGLTVGPGATLETGATNMFVAGHGDAVNASRLITVNGGTWLINSSMDSRIGNVTLSNGATWTSNRVLTGFDVLLANTTAGAATVTVANTGGNTTGSVMNGTGGIHLQGVQNFDVADVTGNASADLTVSMTLDNPGSMGGAAGGINKIGGGTMALAKQATYLGGTTINGGVLDLTATGGSGGVIRGTATINNGGTLRLSAADVTGYGTGTDRLSTINVNAGGTLHVATTANQTLGNAVINLTGGSVTGIAGSNIDFFQGSSAVNTLASSTTATISGTKLTLRQGTGVTFTVADGTTASGIDLDVSSEITNATYGNNPLTKAGDGTMRLSGTNTYTGATNITGGTLLVDGAIGTGAVTVGSGGTLGGGSATAGLIGGNVTIDGTLSPGNSAGTLSLAGSLMLQATANLNWELNSSAPLALGLGVNDLVTVAGDLTLDGILNITGSSSFDSAATGTRWTLLTYGGTLTNNILELGVMPTLEGDRSWELDTSTAGEIGLVIIPEPGAAALIGSFGMLLLLRRRRQG
ncbi:autotransporter-associated beta strand repeat-containing protein [Luteolibacter arcticus]|uniref:Autotransporter-associated beta strand repeat-containing protein n=1 Tax=Luteolibacter arcticus TaxID=1581411 RepID=A0ABT3GRN5_9BACT|nr:autotransporter-associated beta strand repeat-containing protein [Luteolibacter arcticus]MCW1926118.1 autotransporter-associated beta strand repeat-containing protein [Luteolibacter arcticus]